MAGIVMAREPCRVRDLRAFLRVGLVAAVDKDGEPGLRMCRSCLAASFLVNHRRFGGSTAYQAPEPIPTLARLFSRPPSSVLAKMANLDGSRPHGGKWDILAGAMLQEDSARFTYIYRLLLRAAHAEGIGRDRLPDFLDLEDGGEFALLGQGELGTSVFENALRDQIIRSAANSDLPEQDTERIILARPA